MGISLACPSSGHAEPDVEDLRYGGAGRSSVLAGTQVVKTRHEQECRRRLARLQTGKCSVCTRHRWPGWHGGAPAPRAGALDGR